MSKYKVGDKVLVEGVVKSIHIHSDTTYTHEVKIADVHNIYFFEDELMDASKTYSDGLADAWELARKIVLTTEMGGICYDDFKKIFGVDNFVSVLRTMTAQQALAKIDAYEKSQQIQVGDVVYANGVQGVVIDIISDDDCYIYDENGCIEVVKFEKINKTGRTVDISHLLEQIRGNE